MSLGKCTINTTNASWKILRRTTTEIPKLYLPWYVSIHCGSWDKHAHVTAEKPWGLQRGHAKSFSGLFGCWSAVSSWRVTSDCTTASGCPEQSQTGPCNPHAQVVSAPGPECPEEHCHGHHITQTTCVAMAMASLICISSSMSVSATDLG